MHKYLLKIGFLFFGLSSIFLHIPGAAANTGNAGKWVEHFTVQGEYSDSLQNGRILRGTGRVSLYLPSIYKNSAVRLPVVYALPGWSRKVLQNNRNENRDHAVEWRTIGKIETFAEKFGYVIVLVEMGTTTYETRYYPETHPLYKWGEIPGGLWIGKVVVPYIRKHYFVDNTGKKTAIIGLSTGARGAVYSAQLFPEYFRAAVALSGDFDRILLFNVLTKLRRDIAVYEPPSVYIYGDPRRSPVILKRWATDDNPSSDDNVGKLRKHGVSVYLLHGKTDNVCPSEMSSEFYSLLNSKGIDCKISVIPNAGHNWSFWAGQLPRIFDYFKTKFAS